MFTFGELYKELRRERNILQQACCKGIIDKKGLWNFEVGRTTPSFTRVIMLLEKINVSLEEFINYFEKYNPDFVIGEKLKILSRWESFFSMKAKELKEEISIFIEKYMETRELFYQYLSSSLKILYNTLYKEHFVLAEDLSILSDYLFLVENPTKFEYILFINSSAYLSESLISIYDQYIDESIHDSDEKSRLLLVYYIRRIRNLFREPEKNIFKIKVYLSNFEKHIDSKQTQRYFFERLYCNFFRNLLEEWQGNIDTGAAFKDLTIFEYFLKGKNDYELRQLYKDMKMMINDENTNK